MYDIPPFIQTMIDAGYAWVDSEGAVRVHEWCMQATKIIISNSNVNIGTIMEGCRV